MDCSLPGSSIHGIFPGKSTGVGCHHLRAGGCDMARHSTAERSHPMSEVRGRSQEDPMPEGRRPRGVTPHPRSGAEAESTRLQRCRNGPEELPHVPGQGGRPRGDTQRPRSGVVTRGVTPCPRPGAAAGRSYPTPPRPRLGAAARRSNPCPRPGVATRGVTPRPRPGAAAERSNPTPEARGGGREDQPHIQGAVAAGVQEGLEELSHLEGQEGKR